MNNKSQATTNSDRRFEDLLLKIGQYSCSVNNRRIMHDMNNLITSLVLQLSLCATALQAGDSQKASDRLNKMNRMISNLEAFSKALPNRVQITPEPARDRISAIIADTLEFINTYPSLRECQFELDLSTNDTYYRVDIHFIQVMIVAITRQATLSYRNPRVIISCEIEPQSKACILRVEAQGEASSEAGLENKLEEPDTDFIFDNIPLRSLQRIASELHPTLKLQLSKPPSLAFSCRLEKAEYEVIG